MGRDRLVDEIARAMARAENASEDHFEAYRHVAEAVAAVVEPLLAEKDAAEAALAELVRLKDGPRDAAYEEAKPYAWAQARRAALRSACSKCGGVVSLEAVCGSCGDLPAGSLSENEGRVTPVRVEEQGEAE